MKKKVIATILALVMVGSMLAGCGANQAAGTQDSATQDSSSQDAESDSQDAESESQDSAAGEEDKDPETESAAEDLEYVELTWYYRAEALPEQDMVFEKANEIFMKEINAKVNFVPIAPSDYEQKMQTKYASGDAGDINFTSSWTNKYAQNVAKGAFYEMDELLDEYAPGVKEFFTEDQWNAVKINGKIYGIPNAQIFAKSGNLTVRKDLAEKYGLDITTVHSLADLEPFMEQAHSEEGLLFERYGATAGWINVIYAYGFDDISAYAYVRANDPELQVVNPYATEEFAEFCTQAKDWADKGYIANDAMVKKDMEAELKAGKIAARARGVYKPGVEIQEVTQWGSDVELVATMLGDEALLTTSGITSTISAIPASSKNPERAMMALELINTNPELFNLISYGIEGQHYEKVGENMVRQTAKDKYAGIPWMMGNTFIGYILEGSPEDLNEATIELNNSAKASEAMGFVFDAEPVKTQVAQVQTVIDEYLPALNCGAVKDVGTAIDEFNSKLEGAGMNDIVAEAQAQIDAWKTTK